MAADATAQAYDPEFGRLVHEERVKAPLLYLFGLGTLMELGVAVGLTLMLATEDQKEFWTGGVWIFVAVLDAFLVALAAFSAFFMWQEYRTRFGVRWRAFEGGVEWRRGAVVRRLSFRDVKQIGVTQRLVISAGAGVPMSGAFALRLADSADEPKPIELLVRFDALPNSRVSAALTAVRNELVAQVSALMREELERSGRVRWTGALDLTPEGILHRERRSERLVPWKQLRRLIRDAEEFRLAEHGSKKSRLRAPTTGPNFYPGLELIVERTGLQIERPKPV